MFGSDEADRPDLRSICCSVRMSAAFGLRRPSSLLESLDEMGEVSFS